jgi:hypothetical protein
MASFRQDVRFGLRLLFRHPGHTLAAVIALGLGIGLATAMFSIVYGVAYRGLPVPEADRILHVENANPALDQPSLEVFLHDFLDIRERQRSFEGLAGYYDGTLNLSGDGGQPERFNGSFISANAFNQLRVKPVLGRGFLPGEDSPQAEAVAVLSYGVWKTRYQRDPRILGRPVRINGEPGTIVGVMPEGFAFPESTEVWTPLRLDPLRIERRCRASPRRWRPNIRRPTKGVSRWSSRGWRRPSATSPADCCGPCWAPASSSCSSPAPTSPA